VAEVIEVYQRMSDMKCRDRRLSIALHLLGLLLAVKDLGRAEVGEMPNFSEDEPL